MQIETILKQALIERRTWTWSVACIVTLIHQQDFVETLRVTLICVVSEKFPSLARGQESITKIPRNPAWNSKCNYSK